MKMDVPKSSANTPRLDVVLCFFFNVNDDKSGEE